MDTIIIKPRTKKALETLQRLLDQNKNDFIVRRELPEEDIFYPELDKKIKKAVKNKERGETITLETTDSLDDFWEKIIVDESI